MNLTQSGVNSLQGFCNDTNLENAQGSLDWGIWNPPAAFSALAFPSLAAAIYSMHLYWTPTQWCKCIDISRYTHLPQQIAYKEFTTMVWEQVSWMVSALMQQGKQDTEMRWLIDWSSWRAFHCTIITSILCWMLLPCILQWSHLVVLNLKPKQRLLFFAYYK